jgi:hypothetical protein
VRALTQHDKGCLPWKARRRRHGHGRVNTVRPETPDEVIGTLEEKKIKHRRGRTTSRLIRNATESDAVLKALAEQ